MHDDSQIIKKMENIQKGHRIIFKKSISIILIFQHFSNLIWIIFKYQTNSKFCTYIFGSRIEAKKINARKSEIKNLLSLTLFPPRFFSLPSFFLLFILPPFFLCTFCLKCSTLPCCFFMSFNNFTLPDNEGLFLSYLFTKKKNNIPLSPSAIPPTSHSLSLLKETHLQLQTLVVQFSHFHINATYSQH